MLHECEALILIILHFCSLEASLERLKNWFTKKKDDYLTASFKIPDWKRKIDVNVLAESNSHEGYTEILTNGLWIHLAFQKSRDKHPLWLLRMPLMY